MSYRRFNDSEGLAWEAWEVHPSAVERRMNGDRRAERREDHPERRSAGDFRLAIPRELRGGWLALQGVNRRLRVSPIPDGWVHLSDEELSGLVLRARRGGDRDS